MLQRKYIFLTKTIFLELFLLALLINAAQAASANSDTALSALFVDTTWLRDNRNMVVVIDARSEKDFRKGHIPGAISAPWQSFTHMEGRPGRPGWGTLLPPEELTGKIGVLGIDGNTTLVVYADVPEWGEDGRFVWMAMVLGITDVKILDGGFSAWKRNGGEITRQKSQSIPGKPVKPGWNEGLIATTEWMSARMRQIQIVDSRSEKEFAGATTYGEARGGHLPGAISIPFEGMFKPDGTIKSRQELEQIFTTAGLNPEAEIVTYCTAGIRSAHMALVMRIVGFEKARNYDASFYEWAAMKQLPLE